MEFDRDSEIKGLMISCRVVQGSVLWNLIGLLYGMFFCGT